MKKVAILSMQRVKNYGSFLQAYGLKKTIESLGYTVEFVDIKPGENYAFHLQEVTAIGYKKYTGLKKIIMATDKYILKRIYGKKIFDPRFGTMIQRAQNEQLGLSNETNTDVECDTLVIGSDEVFNCVQGGQMGVSYQLFGDYPLAENIITYAASCGYAEIGMIPESIQKKIKAALRNVSSISVRDKGTLNFVSGLTDRKINEHLDPVLITDFSDVREKVSFKCKYILIYAYQNRINLPEEINAIKRFAKKKKLKTLALGGYQAWCDYNILAKPLQLFDFFKNAEYVITDTFHGTVLSIKENCQFAAILRQSNANKLGDLLERFNLTEREITDVTKINFVFGTDIDYMAINKQLAKERERSIEYFKKNIK